MKTVAFYAYKGGTGRTLAAANFAVYLAKLGLRAIIIDFDLEAPGVDSKFPGFQLPKDQAGILEYVLAFQQDGGDPGSVSNLCCEIPVASPRDQFSLGLIPAGDYMAPHYAALLNKLDWDLIFSEQRNGVAFFQSLIARIEKELNPDFLIIDSRTGINEIGGLCTQQLADEVVMLSSVAGESIKMTRHIAELIRTSKIASTLGKNIDVKVVLTRVAKPKVLDIFKREWSDRFGIDEKKLFLLFSCPALEREEFVAMLTTGKEEDLVTGYVQLFQGLDIEVAHASIKDEITRTIGDILAPAPNDAEAKIRELVALYPHPEVYRTAMRFFRLRNDASGVVTFGVKLLDLSPSDVEAQDEIVHHLLEGYIGPGLPWTKFSSYGRRRRPVNEIDEVIGRDRLLRIIDAVFARGSFSAIELIQFADFLENLEEFSRSNKLSMAALEQNELPADVQYSCYSIAIRTALKIKKRDTAKELVRQVPIDRLTGVVADFAVTLRSEDGSDVEAFELAKRILHHDITLPLLRTSIGLAKKIGKIDELSEIISESSDLDMIRGETEPLRLLQEAGLHELAGELGFPRRIQRTARRPRT